MIGPKPSKRRRDAQGHESGMTMIELMLAMVVLAVGMLGVMVLISTAIASNSRNKIDTTGTMLAQTVLEQISAQSAGINAAIPITDCRPASRGGPQTFNMVTTDGASPNGAGALLASGSIDYTQAVGVVPAGYQMTYYTCGANNREVPYDVRWNVMTVHNQGGTTFTKLITVSARQVAPVGGNTQLRYFVPPITLSGIAGY